MLAWVDQCARKLDAVDDEQPEVVKALPLQGTEPEDLLTNVKKPRIATVDPDRDVPMVDVDASEQPEQFAVEQFTGDYTKAELDPLLRKDWIASDGKNFYTTEKFPGNVLTHSLLIPADKSFSVLSSIHREYGHPTIAFLRKASMAFRSKEIPFLVEDLGI